MFRWEEVTPVTIDGMTLRMYREPYEPAKTQVVPSQGNALDHLAYTHLGSELFMYKVLDTNWTAYMEARGDMSRLENVEIPIRDK